MARPSFDDLEHPGYSDTPGQQRIFFDSEFTDLTPEAKLISIGLVSEDGREFYAELSDTYRLDDVSEFVRVAVLPLLEGGDALMSMQELAERLQAWLASFGEPVQLAIDNPTCDWRWVPVIFHDRPWPANLDGTPLLLTMNYLNDYDPFCEAVEKSFSDGLRRHHALDDAKANRLGWIASGGDVDHILATAKRERQARDHEAVRVSMSENHLSVTLPDGETLAFDTDHARDLADALFARGFDADHVQCTDWREGDGSAAPGAGHAIAIKSRLRELAESGERK